MLKPYRIILFIVMFSSNLLHARDEEVVAARSNRQDVEQSVMQKIYDEVKTPYKYGIVLAEEGKKADCPSVYWFDGKWYMTYIIFDGDGYETHLAVSDDLLHWEKLGVILSFDEGTWDANQKAGYIALQDNAWGGDYGIEQFDGRYWMSYIGGALKGYETDPLSVGIAWTKTPNKAVEWDRNPEPVLSGAQTDAREWEKMTLFKSNIIHDKNELLGYPFVMYYNAKPKGGHERIGMAVSNEMINWFRYGNDPVVDHGEGITGDPQITKIGDVWVMFYFGAFWKSGAFDRFACSYDLVHWTTWDGPDLVASSEPWDETYAHKPWVIKHDGIVYHYYCAVGDQGRVIALATSIDLNKQ